MPQIEDTFDIDANGMLHVNAKDLGTGKEQKITITASSGLNKDEIERMRKDAEAHAEEDRQRREEIELRNDADNAVYRSEKMLKDNADKIPGNEKTKVEAAINEVKEAIKGSDTAAIRAASEKLNEAWQTISAELYKAAGEKARAAKGQQGPAEGEPAGGPASGSAGGGKKDEGPIIDAEVVDEKKSS
jgi:molecular chaperone DnaK